jgi:hypothetical protein
MFRPLGHLQFDSKIIRGNVVRTNWSHDYNKHGFPYLIQTDAPPQITLKQDLVPPIVVDM